MSRDTFQFGRGLGRTAIDRAGLPSVSDLRSAAARRGAFAIRQGRPGQHGKFAAWWCLSFAAVAGLAGSASAAEVGSEVRAAIVVSVAGGSSPNGTASHLSVPVTSGVYAGGSISSFTTNRVVDGLATWTDGQFNGANDRYFLLFTSGAAAGWTSDITATLAAAKALDLARAVPVTVTLGDRYRVLKHTSVDTAFQDANATALTTAGNPTDADNVLLFDAAAQRTTTLFKSNVTGFTGWFDSTYAAAGSHSLGLGAGWMVRRKSSVATSLLWVGVARADSLLRSVHPGLNLLCPALAGPSPALVNLGLYTGNTATGVRAGETAAAADRIVVVRPDGSSSTYFYSNAAGQVGWRETTGALADSVTFPAGTAFFLDRDTSLPAFDWRISP